MSVYFNRERERSDRNIREKSNCMYVVVYISVADVVLMLPASNGY